MNVVLLSRDLMLQSRLGSAARNVGVEYLTAGDAAKAIQLAADEACRGVVIDLKEHSPNIAELVANLRSARGDSFLIAACGPHVQETALEAARLVGCNIVATRGQFERDAEAILQAFMSDS
jgi:ActR/RegA family two-component response regulator